MVFYIGYEDGTLIVETDVYSEINKVIVEAEEKLNVSREFYPVEILAEQSKRER